MSSAEHAYWCVELVGSSYDLQRLVTVTTDSWSIKEFNGVFELSSHAFEEYSQPEDVWRHAIGLFKDIALAASLVYTDIGRIHEGKTVEVLADGFRKVNVFVAAEVVLGSSVRASLGGEDDLISKAFEVISDDDSARDLLRWYLNRDVFWTISLRKCFEFIRADVAQSEGFSPKAALGPGGVDWVEDTEFERFDGALYDAVVHGDFALHVQSNRPPHPDPMNRTQAETFIRFLIQRWINWRYTQLSP
jgi:hypothetical protein